jgi:hypothetical protein
MELPRVYRAFKKMEDDIEAMIPDQKSVSIMNLLRTSLFKLASLSSSPVPSAYESEPFITGLYERWLAQRLTPNELRSTKATQANVPPQSPKPAEAEESNDQNPAEKTHDPGADEGVSRSSSIRPRSSSSSHPDPSLLKPPFDDFSTQYDKGGGGGGGAEYPNRLSYQAKSLVKAFTLKYHTRCERRHSQTIDRVLKKRPRAQLPRSAPRHVGIRNQERSL